MEGIMVLGLFVRTVAGVTGLLVAFGSAMPADTYPVRPIRFLLPYPPGGTSDILGRTVAQKLTDSFGKQVIVENRPGADGIIAYQAAATAPPDGYTILLMATSFTVNPSLHAKLPYDPIKSFTAIGLAAVVTNLIAIHPSVPAASLGELVALARRNPGKLNYAGSGMGTASVLGMQLLKERSKANMVLIPYKGTPALITDLIGGQIDLTLNSLPGLLPYVRNHQIRPIAVTGAHRSQILPDVPTVAESGYPGFEANTWYGIIAPAGVPEDIISKLNGELTRIVNSPNVSEYLLTAGFEVQTGTPRQFGEFIRQEIAKWGTVVRTSGLKMRDSP